MELNKSRHGCHVMRERERERERELIHEIIKRNTFAVLHMLERSEMFSNFMQYAHLKNPA